MVALDALTLNMRFELGAAQFQSSQASCIAVGDGMVYVGDLANDCVQTFSLTGDARNSIASLIASLSWASSVERRKGLHVEPTPW